VLEEVEMPQSLDLGIVNLVFARRPRVRKAGTTPEIDTDDHLLLGRVEVDVIDEPRLGNAQCCRK
jgi:hypothetical protein